jgi:hypothetical protein
VAAHAGSVEHAEYHTSKIRHPKCEGNKDRQCRHRDYETGPQVQPDGKDDWRCNEQHFDAPDLDLMEECVEHFICSRLLRGVGFIQEIPF